MKFITEMELRDLYRREPFTSYGLKPGTKLTPGARQFLVDRRVTLAETQVLAETQTSDDKSAEIDEQNQVQVSEKPSTLRLLRRMECVESLFLLIAAELLHSGNAILSEEVMALGKFFQNVQKAEREQTAPDNIQFWGWTEEEIKERANNLEKHVDISEFHVGLDNGKEIALLNYLSASVREVEPEILAVYWNEEKQECSRQDLIDTVNLIINILCVMTWKCLGGRKWKR